MKIQFIVVTKYGENIEYVCDMPERLQLGERITLSNVAYKNDMDEKDFKKINHISFKVKHTDWKRIDQEVVQVVSLKGDLNEIYE